MKQAPYRTFVIAAVIPRGSVPRATLLGHVRPIPLHTLQQLDGPSQVPSGGAQYDALIVGGEDHKTGHENDADGAGARLEHWMRERWPQRAK